jgi:hypothetical protein
MKIDGPTADKAVFYIRLIILGAINKNWELFAAKWTLNVGFSHWFSLKYTTLVSSEQDEFG